MSGEREASTARAFAEIVRHITAADTTDDTTRRHPTAMAITAGLTRIALGWVFLWAFLDKTFGLGFATPREGSRRPLGAPGDRAEARDPAVTAQATGVGTAGSSEPAVPCS